MIQGNGGGTGRPGVGINRAPGRRLLGLNDINTSSGKGVEVNQGTLFQGVGDFNLTPEFDTITSNGYSGISAWNGSSLDIQKVSGSNNGRNGIWVGFHSTMRILGSSISRNSSIWTAVYIYEGSAVYLDTPAATIMNSDGLALFCADNESSFAGDISGMDPLSWSCSNFSY